MRTLRRTLSTATLLVSLALGALMLAPAILHWHRYVITGGSMSGTISRGSLAFAREVPVSTLRVADIITFMPPAEYAGHGLVTHRIIGIDTDRHGIRHFRTKGDANKTVDPWTFGLQRRTQARYRFHVPLVGYAFAALALRPVRIGLIGIPAILIAISVLVSLWRESGEHVRRRSGAAPAGLEDR
jgi:signal peptidase